MSHPHPDPGQDFEGFVESALKGAIAEVEAHPPKDEPEYWLLKSAWRLKEFVRVKAPGYVIEREKRILAERVAGLPVYCAEYDELRDGAMSDSRKA